MRKVWSQIALVAVMLLALPVLANAQTKEFTGKVDKIKDKQIIVDNRMGDKLKFKRLDDTVVEGEKEAWDDVKKGDWVVVDWKMLDKPRKAYKVKVLPPRPDDDE